MPCLKMLAVSDCNYISQLIPLLQDISVVVNSDNIQFFDAGRQGDVPDVDVVLSGPLAALAHVEDRSLGIQQSK